MNQTKNYIEENGDKKEREIEKEQEKTLQNIALNSKTLSNGTYYHNT